VNTRSFSCGSSRAMPRVGPPQPACKSILMERGYFSFFKKFFNHVACLFCNFKHKSSFLLLTEGLFHRSGASKNRDAAAQGNIPGETDRDLVAFHNHRYLQFAFGIRQHFLQFLRVFIHIDIDSLLAIGCPSLDTKGSGICSVDDNVCFHQCLLRIETQTSAGKNFLLK